MSVSPDPSTFRVLMPESGVKRCSGCLQVKPVAEFHLQRDYKLRTVRPMACCRDCHRRRVARHYDAKRRRNGIQPRPPKRNERGEVRCAHCERYLPPDHFRFRRDSNLSGKVYSSYCQACMREMYKWQWRKNVATGKAERNRERELQRRREKAAKERKERQRFGRDALRILGRRGFTATDISRLAGLDVNAVRDWTTGRTVPNRDSVERLHVLLAATSDYPLGERPRKWGRPHPDVPRLQERTLPAIDLIDKGRRR